MHLVCQQKGVLLCKLVFHGREDGVIPEIQMFYPFFFLFYPVVQSIHKSSLRAALTLRGLSPR